MVTSQTSPHSAYPLKTQLRVVYMGSGSFAVPALRVLAASQSAGIEIAAVYSQPPRPSGRGQKLMPTPVASLAKELAIPLYTPLHWRDEATIDEFRKLRPDLIIVASYGRILPPAVLAIPHLGCLNLHGSLLPRWRGAAPLQRAIEAGDERTGISYMLMAEGLDTGPVLTTIALPIESHHTSLTLSDDLANLAADHLIEVMQAWAGGSLKPIPQNHSEAVIAPKLRKEEALGEWTEAAKTLALRCRAFQPWPGLTLPCGGERINLIEVNYEDYTSASPVPPATIISLKPLQVVCGEGVLSLHRVKRAGRVAISGPELANGLRLKLGENITFPS